jgi:bacterioferritin-associated ferredoxin
MYICLCNGFTDRHVRGTVEAGDCSVAGVYQALGCAPKCGKCVPVVRDMLKDHRRGLGAGSDGD